MAVESTLHGATRRSVLAAAGGAVLAWLVQALGRPLPTRATDGDILHIGDFSITGNTLETRIATSAGIAFTGESTGASGSGLFGTGPGSGVVGWGSNSGGGVTGQSQPVLGFLYGPVTKTGVYGVAHQDTTSRGVLGRSTAGVGVQGEAVEDFNNPGIWGAGVIGLSGPRTGAVPAKTGVYGYAAQDAAAKGVTGQSTAGRGLNGIATTGRGVHGQATTGIGVYATATTGTALQAEGPVRFKTSGLATIALGTRSVEVNPGTDLTALTKVLALLQGDPGGSTVVQRVAVNPTTNTFRIYLTANSVRAVKVSWFVMN